MNRGSIYTIETLLLFLGWMILLTIVWNQTGNKTNEMASHWNVQRMEEHALAQSDALLLKHHVNPWQGCAHFDESLRRSLPYVIEEECLKKLAQTPSWNGIFGVSIRKNGKQILFFEKESGERDCVVMGRPAILFPEKETVVLEVKACET